MTKNIGTMSDWQKAYDALGLEDKEIVPADWINAKTYSGETKCEISTAQRHLAKLLAAGKVESREFNRVRHYRLLKK